MNTSIKETMIEPMIEPAIARTDPDRSGWKSLYQVAGWAAILTAVFYPIQIVAFIISPPPATVAAWFQLFQRSRLLGLLDLDLLMTVDQVLAILIFLGLFAALRRTNRSYALIAAVLGVVSSVLFIATNPAFAMLSFSNQYLTAGTDLQQAALLAGGQAALGMWQGSAFQSAYILGSIAPIILSLVMFKTRGWGRAIAWWGIGANVIALCFYVPRIGVYLSIFSVVLLWVWDILVARKFFQLAHLRNSSTSS
jgi:hypothetical protein